MVKKYMHLINGKPAFYWPGKQITFAAYRRTPVSLAKDLNQIRKEQRASVKWRKQRGFHDATKDYFIYGWVRVEV